MLTHNGCFPSVVSTFDHSYNRISDPAPFILGSTIHNRQLASKSSRISSIVICC